MNKLILPVIVLVAFIYFGGSKVPNVLKNNKQIFLGLVVGLILPSFMGMRLEGITPGTGGPSQQKIDEMFGDSAPVVRRGMSPDARRALAAAGSAPELAPLPPPPSQLDSWSDDAAPPPAVQGGGGRGGAHDAAWEVQQQAEIDQFMASLRAGPSINIPEGGLRLQPITIREECSDGQMVVWNRCRGLDHNDMDRATPNLSCDANCPRQVRDIARRIDCTLPLTSPPKPARNNLCIPQ